MPAPPRLCPSSQQPPRPPCAVTRLWARASRGLFPQSSTRQSHFDECRCRSPRLCGDPATFGVRGGGGAGVRRLNQDLINILIVAAAPLAPGPGHTRARALTHTLTHAHTRTPSIWRQRLSRAREEHRKGAKQTCFNNAKNSRVELPSVWGASHHFFNAPPQLWSSGLVARGWRGFRAPCLPGQAPAPRGCSRGLGGGPGWGGGLPESVQWKWHLLPRLPPGQSHTQGTPLA